MSELPFRSAADVLQMLTFLTVAGVMLIGGAVFAVYLMRASLTVPGGRETADAAPERVTAH